MPDAGEVDALAGLLGEDPSAFQVLRGGYRNRVYACRRETQPDAVVKVFVDAPENPLFPTLPDHESAALSLLAGTGIAPRPIVARAVPDVGHVLVYEMVQGPSWSMATSDAAAVGRLLRRVHSLDLSSTTFAFRRLPVTVSSLELATSEILDRVADAPLVRRLRRVTAQRSTEAVGHERSGCLIHTDPGPGNVISGSTGLRLIDWQCPGIGDPIEDLAGFAMPAIQILYEQPPLDRRAIDDLLRGYDEVDQDVGRDVEGRLVAPEPVSTAAARFPVMAPMYSARFAAYCAYRREALAADDPVASDRYSAALAAELDVLEG